MGTTLTLDDDVAIRLKKLKEEGGLAFKDVVNAALRRGLDALERPGPDRPRYRLETVDLGYPRIPLDSTAEALELADGADRAAAFRPPAS